MLNFSAGDGPSLLQGLVNALSAASGASLRYVGQTASGAMVFSGFNGGHLVFMPLSMQSGDARANGVYATGSGNGQYQIVINGTAISVAPALMALNQLAALLPAGATISLNANGVLLATVDGVMYVVQPGILMQQLNNFSGVAQLVLESDGLYHFTDSLGNSQILYPTFLASESLLTYLRQIDWVATMRVQLDGTVLIRLNGVDYTLLPDLTLGDPAPEHAGQSWWQDGPNRFVMRNLQQLGTTQGFGVR